MRVRLEVAQLVTTLCDGECLQRPLDDAEAQLEDANAAIVRGDKPAVGERISAHGTLTDSTTLDLDTDHAYTREPWEWAYMYAISVVAAVWVLGRATTGWRFDRDQLAVVPREHRLPLTAVLTSPSVLVSPAGVDPSQDTESDEPTKSDEDAAMAPTAGAERDG